MLPLIEKSGARDLVDRNARKIISFSDPMDGLAMQTSRKEVPKSVGSNGRCPLCLLSRDRSKGRNCGSECVVASPGEDLNVLVLKPGRKCFSQYVAMKLEGSFRGEIG